METNKFRSVNKNSLPALREAMMKNTNPLITINQYWHSTYHKDMASKYTALKEVDDYNLVLFCWLWVSSSDVFQITKEDVAEIIS